MHNLLYYPYYTCTIYTGLSSRIRYIFTRFPGLLIDDSIFFPSWKVFNITDEKTCCMAHCLSGGTLRNRGPIMTTEDNVKRGFMQIAPPFPRRGR
jgi:hypothetical protein